MTQDRTPTPQADQREPDPIVNEDAESITPAKEPQKKPRTRPCGNYRHLKCDYDSAICSRCQRTGQSCVRGRNKIKFRHGSSARYDSGFAKDQIWLKTSGKSRRLKYIDETGGIVASYTQAYASDSDFDEPFEDEPLEGQDDATGRVSSFTARPHPVRADTQQAATEDDPGFFRKRRRTNDTERSIGQNSLHAVESIGSLPTTTPYYPESAQLLATTPNSSWGIHSHVNPPFTEDFPIRNGTSPNNIQRWPDQSPDDETALALLKTLHPIPYDEDDEERLQAVLLRYFTDELARWFDLCDPERHFGQVVPQRARSCPPLLHAVLTAAARHLSRLRKYRNASGVIEWQGNVLPNLNDETAVRFHNEAIKELLNLSNNPDETHNENLLAAAIILRFYEEVDAPLRDEDDPEVFLRVINIFITAQVPSMAALPHSSPQIYHPQMMYVDEAATSPVSAIIDASTQNLIISPSSSQDLSSTTTQVMTSLEPAPRPTRADGLRQASFWVAFRQELYTSFLKQRPFTFPLNRCEAFRSFAPAEDAVWADRLIIFCADVLEFCYGSPDTQMQPPPAKDRWNELKQHDATLTLLLPFSFQPTFTKAADPMRNQVFPEIWYLDGCHVTGTTHLELARILLAVFDPARPKLGPGHIASMKALSSTLKKIVLKLCGIALSNLRVPPVLCDACLAIAMCGEHFEDRREQDALLGVLVLMEKEHAWPTAKIADGLKKAWGWEGAMT